LISEAIILGIHLKAETRQARIWSGAAGPARCQFYRCVLGYSESFNVYSHSSYVH